MNITPFLSQHNIAKDIDKIKPVVAVPYTEKSYELSNGWISLPQIKNAGIKFFLIRDDGSLYIVD